MGPFVKHLTQRNRSVGEMSIDYATQAAPASEVRVIMNPSVAVNTYANRPIAVRRRREPDGRVCAYSRTHVLGVR
jgi:hypothetical protein